MQGDRLWKQGRAAEESVQRLALLYPNLLSENTIISFARLGRLSVDSAYSIRILTTVESSRLIEFLCFTHHDDPLSCPTAPWRPFLIETDCSTHLALQLSLQCLESEDGLGPLHCLAKEAREVSYCPPPWVLVVHLPHLIAHLLSYRSRWIEGRIEGEGLRRAGEEWQ